MARHAAGHRHTSSRPCPPRPIGRPVPSTRNRYRLLAGALLCLLVVVALPSLYKTDVRVLDEIDNDLEAGPQGWTFRHPAAQHFFLFVEVAFTTLPMAISTAIAAALLFWRKHRRAAAVDGRSDARRLPDDVPAQGRAAAQASGLGGPGHHADQLLVPLRALDRDRRRGRGGDRAGRTARTAPGAAPGAVHGRRPARAARRPGPDLPGRAQPLRRDRRLRGRRVLGARRTGGVTTRRRRPRTGRRSARRGRPPASSRWC